MGRRLRSTLLAGKCSASTSLTPYRLRTDSLLGQVRRPSSHFTSLSLTGNTCCSQDHRGTPEAPGRVVTLIERSFWAQLADHHDSAPEKVWGVAYRIIPDKVAEVKDYLDIREINGYTIHYTPFRPADGSPSIRTLVYIGTPDNDQFVGPQDPQKLAEHILASKGPSGLNKDYLLSLEQSLNELSPESGDAHISDLACRLRALEQDAHSAPAAPPTSSPSNMKFNNETSTREVEEIEKV